MIRIRSKWKTIALLMVVSVCLIVSSFPIDEAVPLKTSAKSVIHEVFPGKTLWSISKRYGVPIESLKRLNELSVTSVVPGQALIIRDKVVVRKGESLWNIAIRHDTDVSPAQPNEGSISCPDGHEDPNSATKTGSDCNRCLFCSDESKDPGGTPPTLSSTNQQGGYLRVSRELEWQSIFCCMSANSLVYFKLEND